MFSDWRKETFKNEPAIFNEDGLVARFELEEERDLVLNTLEQQASNTPEKRKEKAENE